MTQTALLLTTAHQGHARRSDPATSKEAGAAAKAKDRTPLQDRILRLFQAYGPMTDAALYTRLMEMETQLGFTKFTSPSGCRSRRSELSKPNMDRLSEILHENHDWIGELSSDDAEERAAGSAPRVAAPR